MRFNNVVYLKSVSIGMKEVMFDEKKEIIFVGRSNMGKSSLLNTLFEKKDLVKTSSKPGKTRLANIFLVDNKYYLTDMPGYSFAKLGKDLKKDLDSLISWYLEERANNIRRVFLLIDSKLGAQEADIEMYKYILELGLGVTIILSKSDKLNNSQIVKSVSLAKDTFFGQEIIPYSNVNKTGLKELKSTIIKSLK